MFEVKAGDVVKRDGVLIATNEPRSRRRGTRWRMPGAGLIPEPPDEGDELIRGGVTVAVAVRDPVAPLGWAWSSCVAVEGPASLMAAAPPTEPAFAATVALAGETLSPDEVRDLGRIAHLLGQRDEPVAELLREIARGHLVLSRSPFHPTGPLARAPFPGVVVFFEASPLPKPSAR